MLDRLEKISSEILYNLGDCLELVMESIYDLFYAWAEKYPNLLIVCFCCFVLISCSACCGLLSIPFR